VNLFRYVGNDPTNRIDPFGLWYVDLNVSGGFWIGATGGLLISSHGIYPYAGGGFTSPPGGFSLTWSPSDPTIGWNIGLQGGYWIGGQGGYSWGQGGGPFWEFGFVTPEGSLTGYYVWNPWRWPWEKITNNKQCK